MKYAIEFDTAVDRYEDVLQRLRRIYGILEESGDESLSRTNLTRWLAAMKKPGDQMVLLLANANCYTMTKEEVVEALGLQTNFSRTLGGLVTSVGAAAKKNLPRDYWWPFGFSTGTYRNTYTLDERIAKAMKELLG